jgi:hypothetical protein
MKNPRHIFTTVLHPKPMQVDLHQFGMEFTSLGGQNLNLCSAAGDLIRMRIREGVNRAAGHGPFSDYTDGGTGAVVKRPRAPIGLSRSNVSLVKRQFDDVIFPRGLSDAY